MPGITDRTDKGRANSPGPVGSGRPPRQHGPGGVGKSERQRRADNGWPRGWGSHTCSRNAAPTGDNNPGAGKTNHADPWNAIERDPATNIRSGRSGSKELRAGSPPPPSQAAFDEAMDAFDKATAAFDKANALGGSQRPSGGEHPLPPPPVRTSSLRQRSSSPTRYACVACSFPFPPITSDDEGSDTAEQIPLSVHPSGPGWYAPPEASVPDPKIKTRSTREARRERPSGAAPGLFCGECGERGETTRPLEAGRHPAEYGDSGARHRCGSGDPPARSRPQARNPSRTHPPKGVRFPCGDQLPGGTPGWTIRSWPLRIGDGRLCQRHSKVIAVLEDLMGIGVLGGVMTNQPSDMCGSCTNTTTL